MIVPWWHRQQRPPEEPVMLQIIPSYLLYIVWALYTCTFRRTVTTMAFDGRRSSLPVLGRPHMDIAALRTGRHWITPWVELIWWDQFLNKGSILWRATCQHNRSVCKRILVAEAAKNRILDVPTRKRFVVPGCAWRGISVFVFIYLFESTKKDELHKFGEDSSNPAGIELFSPKAHNPIKVTAIHTC